MRFIVLICVSKYLLFTSQCALTASDEERNLNYLIFIILCFSALAWQRISFMFLELFETSANGAGVGIEFWTSHVVRHVRPDILWWKDLIFTISICPEFRPCGMGLCVPSKCFLTLGRRGTLHLQGFKVHGECCFLWHYSWAFPTLRWMRHLALNHPKPLTFRCVSASQNIGIVDYTVVKT